MQRIELRGKYAVGAHSHALVDDDLFDELNKWAWKAKPNGSGSGIYATRVHKGADGVSRDVRMHRVVLGYSGPLDVDHINHDSLDNQRSNLRIATRSVNVKNGKPTEASGLCVGCGQHFVRLTDANHAARVVLCSPGCGYELKRYTYPSSYVTVGPHSLTCKRCAAPFEAARCNQKYCSDRCKQQAKWLLMKERGSPSVAMNAERGRAWRATQKIKRNLELPSRNSVAPFV